MAATDTLINTLFDGRYRILRKLGSGGMANVYLAEDEDLGRRVAIKILNERYAGDESFTERFRREAKSAAALSHPNIVSIYDRGQADGKPYIAMEVIEGRSLKELILTRGALGMGPAIDYTKQILGALRFAHRHGIIHRDIKPHNILLGSENRLKVTDFGIARAGHSQMTEVGSIMGTAQYLSPEQARGSPVTAASDLYSIGIVLYEMLTGQVPFSGDSAIEIAMKHLNEPPRPPSTLRPEIPPELDQVVLRALAKNAEDRYQTADELIEDLDRVEAGIPLSPETATAATSVLAALPATQATEVLETPPTTPLPPTAPRRPPPTYPPRYSETPPRRRRRRWLPWLLVLLLLAGAAVAGWYVYSQIQDELRSSNVAVPGVVGLRKENAIQRLRNAGFQVQVNEGSSDTVDRGFVIAQDPAGGTRIPGGDPVRILVSTGKAQVDVPNVVGLSYDQAFRILTDQGFKVDRRDRFSPDVAQGDVMDQDPNADTKVPKGSTVEVIVSRGQELATVPSVVNQSRASAEDELQASGFAPSVVKVDSDAAKGTVVAQDPSGGAQVPKGSTVQISVSRGPPLEQVPDERNKTRQEAEADLRAQGFRVQVVEEDTTDPTKDDVVIDQDPNPGTKVEPGSTVTITVGRFVEPATATTDTTGNSGSNGQGSGNEKPKPKDGPG